MHFDAIVVGGGINGLCTAYHLRRLGVAKIAVVERFRFGHDRGSSHGLSRITRSTYGHADYVRLMQHVHAEEWPRLECDLAATLIHRTPGCFFGPSGKMYRDYRDAVGAAGASVESMSAGAARAKFPQFTFADSEEVLVDHTAGLVAAADVMAGLMRWLGDHDVNLLESTPVTAIKNDGSVLSVETDRGNLTTDRLAVANGAWIGELIPELRPKLTVVRQTVGYFRLTGPVDQYRCGAFPVWCYLHDSSEQFYYGLPEFGPDGGGIKYARHRTSGVADDPEALPTDEDREMEIAPLRQFAAKQFTAPIEQLVRVEHCLYTNTADEDFVIDLHPRDQRIAIASACSGHGFKFGPFTGRVVAELLVHGRPTLPDFVQIWPRFQLGKSLRHA